MTNLLLGGLLAFTMGSVAPSQVFGQEYTEYRQTYYTVAEGEYQVGAREQNGQAINLDNPNVRIIDNQVMYNDAQYGYVPIVAINLNEVLDSKVGQYTYGVYGSIIEMRYPNGTTQNAIILDACGACRYANKIDKWINQPDSSQDVQGVSYTYKRYGWDTYKPVETVAEVVEDVVEYVEEEVTEVVEPVTEPKNIEPQQDEITYEEVTEEEVVEEDEQMEIPEILLLDEPEMVLHKLTTFEVFELQKMNPLD